VYDQELVFRMFFSGIIPVCFVQLRLRKMILYIILYTSATALLSLVMPFMVKKLNTDIGLSFL
jgi:hypothetical protein